jgi:hypothetical protein
MTTRYGAVAAAEDRGATPRATSADRRDGRDHSLRRANVAGVNRRKRDSGYCEHNHEKSDTSHRKRTIVRQHRVAKRNVTDVLRGRSADAAPANGAASEILLNGERNRMLDRIAGDLEGQRVTARR